MYETVEVACRLLNGLPHVIVAVEIEDVRYEVQRILIVLHLGVKARQVEPVRQVVLVDHAEVFIAARGYELRKSALVSMRSGMNEDGI
jgi:hypothetical protein